MPFFARLQPRLAVDGVPPPRLFRRAQLRRPFYDRRPVDHRNRRGKHRVRVGRVSPGNIVLPEIVVIIGIPLLPPAPTLPFDTDK